MTWVWSSVKSLIVITAAGSVLGDWLDCRWTGQSLGMWGIDDGSVFPCPSLSQSQPLTLRVIAEVGGSLFPSTLISMKPFLRPPVRWWLFPLPTSLLFLRLWSGCRISVLPMPLSIGQWCSPIPWGFWGVFNQEPCFFTPGWPVKNPTPLDRELGQGWTCFSRRTRRFILWWLFGVWERRPSWDCRC